MGYGHPGELAADIEDNQCFKCTYRVYHGSDGDHDFNMCPDIEAELVLEGNWPDEIEEDEFTGEAYCTKFRDEVLDLEAAPEQEKLF